MKESKPKFNHHNYKRRKKSTNLKGTVEAAGNLFEKLNHASLEFSSLCSLQHFLKFSKEENFLLTIGNRPVLQQAPNNRISQLEIFLHKLGYAVRQLLVVHNNRFRFMQRQKSPNKKQLMLLFHGQSKPINNATKNL